MKTFLFLSATVMFHPQFSQAEVDLLSGAFQFAIPNTSLDYSSRRAELSRVGFGWTGSPPAGAVVKVVNGDLVRLEWKSQVWLFRYDTLHNLTEIKQPAGYVTRVQYNDSLDRVQILSIDGGCKEEFKYLERGRELHLDARKVCPGIGAEILALKALYSNDRHQLLRVGWRKIDNRFVPSKLSKGSVHYDELGRLALYVMDDELLSYEYDGRGGLIAITREISARDRGVKAREQIQFTYDLNYRLSTIITDKQEEIHLKYDSSGRLQSLDENTLAVATALQAALDKISPIEGGLTL